MTTNAKVMVGIVAVMMLAVEFGRRNGLVGNRGFHGQTWLRERFAYDKRAHCYESRVHSRMRTATNREYTRAVLVNADWLETDTQ